MHNKLCDCIPEVFFGHKKRKIIFWHYLIGITMTRTQTACENENMRQVAPSWAYRWMQQNMHSADRLHANYTSEGDAACPHCGPLLRLYELHCFPSIFFSFKLDFRASVCSTLSSFRIMILVNYKEKKYATHKLSYSRKTQPYQHGPKPSIAAITATGTCMWVLKYLKLTSIKYYKPTWFLYIYRTEQ